MNTKKILLASIATIATVGAIGIGYAGVTYAADTTGTGTVVTTINETRDAIQKRVAEILGITQDQLVSAEKQAHTEQVDADLAAGKITEAQATQMKTDIANGVKPGRGEGMGGGMMGGRGGMMGRAEDVAAFLGITTDELKASKDSGQTIEELVVSKGKTMADFRTYMETNK